MAVYDYYLDNFNDIFAQRWRKEHIPYEVICRNRLTGVEEAVEVGVRREGVPLGVVCKDPEEEKIIIGQGTNDGVFQPVSSKFVSPDDPTYSFWRPTSVSSVAAQAWSANYMDGFCGIRKLNDDFKIDPELGYSVEPRLDKFVPEDRSTCSNIRDNPIHDSMADKLIGALEVVGNRRAKFVSVARMTADFLDTTGQQQTFEGELENGDLMTIIGNMGQFGFGSGDDIATTFRAPVRSEFQTAVDYKTRFRQYIANFNDVCVKCHEIK